MSEIQKVSIIDFKTDSGALYKSIDLFFQHFGKDYNKAPIVLVNHSLTGDSNVSGNKGWWSGIIGPRMTIDTDYYSVLAFNIPGNGFKGSKIKKHDDFHTGDVARLFFEGLKILGITELFAIIGGSIGGSIVWEMGALYPSFSKHLIPVASDWKASDWIIANTFLQKRILENSSKPLEDARIHAMLTYRTPRSFDSRFDRTKNEENNMYNVENWLIHHGKKLNNRFKLDAYIFMNHLLASVDITRSLKSFEQIIKKINSSIHLIAIDSDLYFFSYQDELTFKKLKKIKKNIFYHEIKSIHGHDAFLIENDIMSNILKPIFSQK